ncbi:MAG: rhodanese-like domain-containing protein [Candidatus Hodarchaeales archaeon]
MINRNEARMGLRFLRLMSWRVIKRKWYLPNVPEITVKELFDRLNSSNPPFLLDLRDKEHFEGNGQDKYDKDGHIEGAKWIPMMKLSNRFDEIPKEREIVTMCPGGGMSLVGVELLKKEDYKNVKSLKGGIWEWAKKGYPLVRSTISKDEDSSSEDIEASSVQDRSTGSNGA